MYISVKDVKPVDNYKLVITFSNNEVKIFDMNPYLEKGVFKELKEISMFKSVRVNFDTIEWKNDADIDPEILYEDSIPYKIG